MTSLSSRPLTVSLVLGIIVALTGLVSPRIADAHPATAVVSPMVTVTPNVVTVGSTAIVHGTNFTPNDRAFVFWQRPDRTTHGVWILTNSSGMFSLQLGFARRHGAGTEFVSALDFATNLRAPFVAVTVNPAPIVVMGQLSASPNPVMNAGTTLIVGTGFAGGTRVLVTWSRPDGTRRTIEVIANGAGTFTFQLFADPRHGCGMRTFVAFDLATATQTAPFSLAETC
jgi:hypothetical protein